MTADLRRNPANQYSIPCSDGSIKSQIKGSACTYVLYVRMLMEYSYNNSIRMLTGVGVLQFSTHPSPTPHQFSLHHSSSLPLLRIQPWCVLTS